MFNHTFVLSIIAASLLYTPQVRTEEPIMLKTVHQELENQEDISSYYTLPPLLMKMIKVCTQDIAMTNELIKLNREHLQAILHDYYHDETTARYFMRNPSAKKVADRFKQAVEKQKPLTERHMVSCLTMITKTLQQHIIEHHDEVQGRIREKIHEIYSDNESEEIIDTTEGFLKALESEKKHKRLAQTFFFINNLVTTVPLESQNEFIKTITLDTTVRRTLQEGFLHPNIYLAVRSLPDITTLFPQLEKTNKLPALFKPYATLLTNPELSLLVLTTLHECIAPTFHKNTLLFLDAMTTALSQSSSSQQA